MPFIVNVYVVDTQVLRQEMQGHRAVLACGGTQREHQEKLSKSSYQPQKKADDREWQLEEGTWENSVKMRQRLVQIIFGHCILNT